MNNSWEFISLLPSRAVLTSLTRTSLRWSVTPELFYWMLLCETIMSGGEVWASEGKWPSNMTGVCLKVFVCRGVNQLPENIQIFNYTFTRWNHFCFFFLWCKTMEQSKAVIPKPFWDTTWAPFVSRTIIEPTLPLLHHQSETFAAFALYSFKGYF